MINIHLLVAQDYIEELMMNLPKDKVKVVEKNFEENKILLQSTLNEYRHDSQVFTPYKDCIENVNAWLEDKK